MNFDLEVTPYAWLGFYFDTRFNPQDHELETANFDLYINGREDRWFVRFGQRYHFDVDQLLETEVGWKLNQKWSTIVNYRYDLKDNERDGEDISLRRDLHSWYLDFLVNDDNGGGQEFMLVFTLKGFDDVKLEGGRSFEGGSEQPGAQETD